MDLEFNETKHETLVNDYDALSKKYNRKGQCYAMDILATINALHAAPTLHDVPRSFRPHPLQGNYKGHFAADVDDLHRVIFRPNEAANPEYRIDNFKTIKRITIIEIFSNYH